MLFDASGNGEDVRIKNDILGRKSNFINKDVVGAFADAAFVFVGGGLALFIECHHDNGCSVV